MNSVARNQSGKDMKYNTYIQYCALSIQNTLQLRLSTYSVSMDSIWYRVLSQSGDEKGIQMVVHVVRWLMWKSPELCVIDFLHEM